MQIRKRSIVNSFSLERAAANIQIIISQAEVIFIFNFTIPDVSFDASSSALSPPT